jgi:hypothetical protein
VAVGSNALLCFRRAYADPALEASPGPRIHRPTGLMAKSGRALLVATSASRHVVDLLVLAADVAEALQFRGSRGG